MDFHTDTRPTDDKDVICRVYLSTYNADRINQEILNSVQVLEPIPIADSEPQAYRQIRNLLRNREVSTEGCITVRFSNATKMEHGFTFGSGAHCNVCIPEAYVANEHFSITFSEGNRLVVRDLGAKNGTNVRDGEYEDYISNSIYEIWTTEGGRNVWVSPYKGIWLYVIPAPQSLSEECYQHRVSQFKRGVFAPEDIYPEDGLEHLDLVGEGGQAVAERVSSVGTGVIYVMKTARDWDDEPNKDHVREGFRKEAQLMAPMRHANIVRFFYFTVSQAPSLLLEWVQGGDLLQSAHAQKLVEYEAHQVLEQGLSALAYIHEQCRETIAHRDVKPENLLVAHRAGGKITIKLADFGCATTTLPSNDFCGTDRYVSPEMFQDDLHCEKVDLWALGVSVAEFLHRIPNDTEHPSYLTDIRAISTEAHASKDTNPIWATLVHMLELDPDDRWSAQACLDFFKAHPSYNSTPRDTEDGDDSSDLSSIESLPTPRRMRLRTRGPKPPPRGQKNARFGAKAEVKPPAKRQKAAPAKPKANAPAHGGGKKK